MKNIYIGMILFCVMFTACKKDNKQANISDNKLHNVTFSVNSFLQQHLGFQTNMARFKSTSSLATTATDTIQNTASLYYLVFDGSGKIVHNIHQEADTTSNFGTITDKLSSGTYTVVLAGGEDSYIPANNNHKFFEVSAPTLSTGNIMYQDLSNDLLLFSETFYKKFTLTVTNSNISQNITLPHIVAQVLVNIQDAIPSNVAFITLTFNSQPATFNLSTGLPDAVQGPAIVQYSDFTTGETNYSMTNYTINTVSPFAVTITAYHDIHTIIASKTIQNVTCAANQQITLTGNLFGGSSNAAGGGSNNAITADTTWNNTTLNYSF